MNKHWDTPYGVNKRNWALLPPVILAGLAGLALFLAGLAAGLALGAF